MSLKNTNRRIRRGATNTLLILTAMTIPTTLAAASADPVAASSQPQPTVYEVESSATPDGTDVELGGSNERQSDVVTPNLENAAEGTAGEAYEEEVTVTSSEKQRSRWDSRETPGRRAARFGYGVFHVLKKAAENR